MDNLNVVTTKCQGELAIEHTTPGERHQDSQTVFFCFLQLLGSPVHNSTYIQVYFNMCNSD